MGSLYHLASCVKGASDSETKGLFWSRLMSSPYKKMGDNKSATEDKDLSTNLKLKDGKSMQHIKQMSNSKERSYSPKVERGCLKDGKKSMQHINKKNHQRLSKGAWPNTSLVAHHCPMAVGTPGCQLLVLSN